ncbi:MAG: glycosyltransferase family 39 protein [Phycisphaeraceae bacterium]|nr:glycosyltransferase family 39 protein [Phycisphaerales bacterium]MCB9841989.1 glycosyltransferase family 39 protein [Phycisphaeraceae bacterium]
MESATQPETHDRAGAWRAVWIIIALVTIARIVFLVWFSPYELTGDEAHYWEWSRRPALSYYTKGPGVAWVIAASTSILGTSEATVRLPAVLASACAMVFVAGLGAAVMPNSKRAPVCALLVYLCVPAYHAVALLMTIDGPMIACWLGAALGAAWAMRGMMRGGRALGAHAMLGAAIGIGFLFKYTILLMLVGVVCAWIGSRGSIRGKWMPGAALGLAVAIACASPVLIWNQQHGWPTVAHLLGHLGAEGGDIRIKPDESPAWTPMWTLEMIGSQIALVGPALVLMFLGMRGASDAARAPAHLRRLLVWCGAPTIVFYLGVTLFAQGEGNWPIATYATWSALGGAALARGVRGWKRAVWHWGLGYGVIAAVGMLMLPAIARLPGAERIVPTRRFSGARAAAGEVESILKEQGLKNGFVIANRYQRAGLLAFYMDGRPVVYCAQHILGDRRTSYDDFADTSLENPSLIGRDAVLVDGGERRWSRGFLFDWVEQVREEPMRVHLGRGYRGLSPESAL